ncbi:hypothetical protein CCR80_08175 [Rhodothalassium salexigens]|uniref:class I SAM-dependent methyltransferase n=1 Tax=Rhodothalassium salexigens TaxID=1086 RepID=UPI0019136D22|nr:class I SAM-dependent methyltransferase [Rhodothalassium salexigens]MBK5921006.1 hypothetical protein [Rhodothalassium salexigens]
MASRPEQDIVPAPAPALKAGDAHYTAYVGPPEQYDFMGATQFRLLCSLGLRRHHRVLDIGCGSLRAGRLLIPYLDPGRYHGIEPNTPLIDAAFEHELGHDIRRIKAPCFAHVDDFSIPFDGRFDMIVAQSIYSHTGTGLLARSLTAIAGALAPAGQALVTIIEGGRDHPGDQWVYPGCVTVRPATLRRLAARAGLGCERLPWFHPRQTWYRLTGPEARRLRRRERRHLSGAVLGDPTLSLSHRPLARARASLRPWIARRLPARLKRALKRG